MYTLHGNTRIWWELRRGKPDKHQMQWRVGNENGVLTVVEQPCQYAPQAGQEQATRQSGD